MTQTSAAEATISRTVMKTSISIEVSKVEAGRASATRSIGQAHTAQQSECQGCVEAQLRAKDEGHRDWRTKFACYDCAAVDLDEWFAANGYDDRVGPGVES